MKKYLLASVLLFTNTAYALDSATELINLGMSPPLAAKVVTIVNTLASPFPTNTFVTFRNAANSANINVLKIDATDDTVLNADTGDIIKLSVAGTSEVQITDDTITFTGAAGEIVPGATSFAIRNTADAVNNVLVSDAGLMTVAAGLTATTANITATAGDVIMSTSGNTLRLQEATAGAKCMGTLTANGTTVVTTATTCALTASRIFFSGTSDPSGTSTNDQVGCWTTNIVNATSFDFDCSDAANSGTFNWFIINESA